MEPSQEPVPANYLTTFLAGLQAGMVAVFWMLVWLGISAMWMHRSFWSPANIMATVFFGDDAIHPSFASTTPSGIALYLTIYSLLGAAFAICVRQRLTGLGTLLVCVLFSVVWYWLFFRVLALHIMPLVWLLHTERSTQFGHVIFGALLSRFGDYLPRRVIAEVPVTVQAEAAD